MIKYEDGFTGIVYDDENDCCDAVLERLDDDDIEEALQMECTMSDILYELRRLDSPLFWRAYERAKNEICDDYVIEVDDDE